MKKHYFYSDIIIALFSKPSKAFRLLMVVFIFIGINTSIKAESGIADYTYSTGSGTHYISNGGNNYKALFTLAANCVTGISVNPTTVAPICVGSTAATLTATITTASGSGDANITYEWFSNTSNSTTGGTLVQSTTATTATTTSSYTPSTATDGTLWYYCTVTNTDATCSGSFTTVPVEVVVTSPPVFVSATVTSSILCNGGTATVTLVATGGTAPISYTFNSQTNTTGIFTGVLAGTNLGYSITDGNSCTPLTGTISVTQPTALSLTSASVTSPILCNGGTATVTLVAAGGTAPISYTFNSQTNTMGIFTGVLAGTNLGYSITDGNSCTPLTGTISVTQPTALSLTSASVTSPILCNGGTATVTIVAAGGTAPISYTFNSQTNTTGIFTGVLAGTNLAYSITDANSCTPLTGTISVTQPTALTFTSATVTSPILCNGGTATVTLVATGGTAPISYTFNSQTNTTGIFTGVLAGTNLAYSITDANSCTPITGTINVTQPTALTFTSATVTSPILCNGGTATVTLVATGGTAPISYTFNSQTNTTGIFTGVLAGNSLAYSITDGNSCTPLTGTISVTQPTALTINSINSNSPICFGNTINLTSSASGGTGVITYSWTGPNSFTSNSQNPSITGVTTAASGTYHLTVTDSKSCSTTSTTNVIVNPLPTATITGTTAVCQNSTAPNITFTGGIGTAPFTFIYKLNGGANQTVTTSSGNSVTITAPTGSTGVNIYSLVSVSDVNGCSQLQSGTATITVNTLPTASISGSTTVCQNSAIAPNITFTAGNGLAPYTFTYTLNGGSNLTVTTSSGNSVTVPASTAITGNSVYTLVSVADANGCSQLQSGSANINVKQSPTAATIGGTTTVCQNAGTPNLTFSGTGGTTPYTFTYTINGGANQTVSTVGGSSITVAAPTGTAGTFTYSLVSIGDLNSCTLAQTGSAVITVNPLPTAVISGTTAVCLGGTSPIITFTGATGTAPYTFTYKINGGANQTITTVSGNSITVAAPTGTSGTYTYSLVSVSDNNGCSQSQVGTAVITVNTLPTASISGTLAVCQNNAAPNITFTGSNGAAPYTFTYNINGGANQTITTVSGNTVSVAAPTGTVGTFNYNLVSVSGSNTCNQSQVGTATITVKTNPTVNAVANAIYCNGEAGSAISFSSNPVGATFSWTSSANIGFGTSGTGNIAAFTAINTGSSAVIATISVIATANSCPGIATTFTITVNPSPAVNPISNVSNCNGATVSGINFGSSTTGVTYDWTSSIDIGFDLSGTGDIPAFIGQNPGTTPVTATISVTASANGCTGSPRTFTITINPSPELTSSDAPGTICSNSLFSYTPSSSLAGTSFTWTRAAVAGISNAANSGSGNINETLVNTTENPIGVNYVYTLTSGGCPATFNVAIVVVPAPTVTATATLSTICVGGSTSLSSSSSIVASLPATLLTQNFNSALTGWTLDNASTGGVTANAAWASRPDNYNIGGFFGNYINSNDDTRFYLSDSYSQNGSITSTTLQSPVMNTIGYTSLSLNFWHYYRDGNRPNEAARVQVSTNGSTWTTVTTYNSNQGQDDNFENPTISLNSYVGNATLYVRFYYYAQGRARYWAIDNVTITGTSPSATVSWTSVPAGFTSSVANPGSVSPPVTTVYTATYTDPNNTACPGSKSATVTVNPKPVIPNQTATVCSGSTFSVTPVNGGTTIVPAGTTYSWPAPVVTGVPVVTGGSAQSGQTSISQTLTNTSTAVQTATYTVTATTGSCPGSTFTVIVSVYPKPVVNAVVNAGPYCNGAPATAINFSSTTTTTGVTYDWTSTADAGFGLSGTGNIPAFTALNTTNAVVTATVTVTASTLSGCSGAPKTFTITVNPTPAVKITANYCAVAGKIQLTASGGGTYLWNTGATTPSINVDVAGVYSVTGTLGGCSFTDFLNVAQELVINGDFTAGNTGFTSGYAYKNDVAGNNELVDDSGNNGYAVGTSGQNYHYDFWGIDHTKNTTGSKNFMLVNGHGSTITIWQQTVNVQPNTDYYFSAWAMSLNDSGPFARLRFEVNGVQVGTTAVLTQGPSNATQAAANNYWTRFYSNPVWKSGAVSGPITIRIVNLENSPGGNDFALDDISFGTLAAVPFSINPSSNADASNALCAGATLNLSVNLTNGKAPITSSWIGPNGFTSNLANPSISNVTAANAGTYTATVTDGYGCGSQTKNVMLTVTALPTCSISGNNDVCPSSTNTYSAPTGMTSYSWSVTAGSATISGSSNGQTVSVKAPATCGAYTLSLTTVKNSCSSTCTQIFNAVDTTKPVITLAASSALGCNASPANVAAAFGTASVTDNCSTGLVATGTIAPEVVTGCTVSVTKNWTVTDICGNTQTNSQTVTFTRDTTKPVIAISAATALGCNPTAANINSAFGTASVTDNCSTGLTATFTNAAEINSSGCTYSTTRTWTVTDNCGNIGTNSQTVTYTRDSTKPVLVGVPANITVQCNAIPTPAIVTATDGCSTGTVSAAVDVITPGSCSGSYTITRTWTATDVCGNSVSASQIITVTDTTPPVLSGIPANVAVQCNAIPAVPGAGVVTATDNCGTATVTGPVIVNTAGACVGSSIITRTWTAIDQCGNSTTATQTITVTDTTKPVLANIPSNVSVLCSAIPAPPAAGVVTATDNCSTPTVSASVDVITPGSCSGSYIITRTWTATDQCGNAATASQIITVSDYIAPVLSGIPFNTTVQCSAIPSAAIGITAADNCDVNPVITLNETIIPGLCPSTYTLVRTWTATDSCGNSSSEAQTINVVDTTPPVITCPANIILSGCNATIPAANSALVTATDNCSTSGAITIVHVGDVVNTVGCTETITRTYKATDACGNFSTCTQLITRMTDNTPPVITCPASQIFCQVIGNNYTIPTLVSNDNCSGALTVTFNITGATIRSGSGNNASGLFNVGVSTITWTVIDACGNSSNCSATVTINGLPVITTQPISQLDCEGASVNFSVVATGVGLTYTWQRKKPTDASFITIPVEGNVSYPLSPLSTRVIKIDNVGSSQSPNGTQYQVVITNSSGCSITSSAATLSVNEITGITSPILSPVQPLTDVKLCFGANYSYTVSTSTPPPGLVFSYQWKTNASGSWDNVVDGVGTHFSGATTATLNIINGTPAESAEYKVLVIFTSSGANCNVTTTLTRRITFLPEVTPPVATITQPDCITPTGSVTLSGLPASGTWTLTRSGASSATTTGSGTSTIITGLAPGTYTYTVTLGTCTSLPSSNVVIQAATTAIWNGSGWTNGGPPTINQALEFTGDYTSPGDLTACSCTVTSGVVVFKPTHTLKITNWVHVNGGSLTFKNNASLVQINNVSNTNSGNIRYERQTSVIRNTDYTYWSSPVAGFTLGGVSPNTVADKFYSFDSGIEDWKQESAATTMVSGVGYIVRGPQTALYMPPNPPNFYQANFVGVPNNGHYEITGVSANKSLLMGNPYPSALDANTFLDDNQNVLDGTLYFWTHNTQIAIGTPDPGSGLWAYSGDDYASYNRTGGVATAAAPSVSTGGLNINIPSGKIASGQGFFGSTIMSPTGTTIVFDNSMRVGVGTITGNNSQFFKTKAPKSIEKHRIWLNLTNPQGAFKQTLIGYVTDATNGYEGRFDGESYDGNDFLDFYSVNEDKNLTIQGRALPFDINDEIPLGYRVALDGTFSVAIGQTDGLLSNQPVFIEDKLANSVFNLKEGNYTFTTTAGTFDDRFVLRYTDKTLSTEELVLNDGITVLYSNNYKTLIIRNNLKDATINSVSLYNMAGQNIANWDVKGREQTSIQIPIKNLASDIYIVKVKTNQGESSKKIIIKE